MWIILGLPFNQKSRKFIIDLSRDGYVPIENLNDALNNPEELYAQRDFIDLDASELEEPDLEPPEIQNNEDQDLHDHQIYMRERPDSLELS